jgi:endonuclease YncB( thermonuclease family)
MMSLLRFPEAGAAAHLSLQILLVPAVRWVHGACAAALVVLGGSAASATELSGHPRILDGGTLLFGDATVILKDIFAPQKEQSCSDRTGAAYPCGEIAAAALSDEIATEEIRCEGTELDLYYNLHAICWKGGEDLNAWMVRHGWARAKQSSPYLPEEKQARAEEAGLWGR